MTLDLITKDNLIRRHDFQYHEVYRAIYDRNFMPPKDLILVLGGYGESNAAEELAVDAGTGSSILLSRLKAFSEKRGNTLVKGWQSSLDSNYIIPKLRAFIEENFHPLGKIIACGYSAGGFNVLDLTYDMTTFRPFYDLQNKSFRDWFLFEEMDYFRYGYPRIDLAVTIDAARGPLTDLSMRAVWPCARKNLNFYQTNPSRIGSHGGPNYAVTESTQSPDNRDLSERYVGREKQGHASIDEDTMEMVIAYIENALIYPVYDYISPYQTAWA